MNRLLTRQDGTLLFQAPGLRCGKNTPDGALRGQGRSPCGGRVVLRVGPYHYVGGGRSPARGVGGGRVRRAPAKGRRGGGRLLLAVDGGQLAPFRGNHANIVLRYVTKGYRYLKQELHAS